MEALRARPVSARGISLREVLPDAKFIGADDLWVTSCASDSRVCRRGDLFAGLLGTRVDGHEFVRNALERGAAGVLAERLVPTHGRPLCIVPDTREAYGRICQALAGNPSQRVKTIGVTGTNGKTTTSYLIAGILHAAGCCTGVMGTLGCWDGNEREPTGMTTPSAPTLADWLARAEVNGCSHAVLEVSSHALSQRRVAGISFDAACVTNVRSDHLDYHNTLQNYRNAKARLFEQLSPDGFAVINADDPISHGLLNNIHGPALTVAIDAADAEITATVVERFASEQTFLISAGNETAAVRTRMIGDHHVYNCLTAAAVGLIYGIDLPTVARGLSSVEKIPGRLEPIACGQSFGVFVDYAHTPDALATVLSTLRQVTEGRVLCVFGAGGDRDRKKRPQMAAAVERMADLAIVTSDNPRGEDPLDIIDEIQGGFTGRANVRVIADRAEAIEWALGEARRGDTVLIAGKGHEEYQIIGSQRFVHDDRLIARRWLYDHASAGPVWSAAQVPA